MYVEYLQVSEDKQCSQVIWMLCFKKARRYSVRQECVASIMHTRAIFVGDSTLAVDECKLLVG